MLNCCPTVCEIRCSAVQAAAMLVSRCTLGTRSRVQCVPLRHMLHSVHGHRLSSVFAVGIANCLEAAVQSSTYSRRQRNDSPVSQCLLTCIKGHRSSFLLMTDVHVLQPAFVSIHDARTHAHPARAHTHTRAPSNVCTSIKLPPLLFEP